MKYPNKAWTEERRAKVLLSRSRSLPDRLAKFQIVRGPDECWGWTGCDNGVGYAYLRIDKKLRLATHVALEVDGRSMPQPGMHACHRCDNPICTNPRHLWWGTPSENTTDGYRKGRIKTPTERSIGAPVPEVQW